MLSRHLLVQNTLAARASWLVFERASPKHSRHDLHVSDWGGYQSDATGLETSQLRISF